MAGDNGVVAFQLWDSAGRAVVSSGAFDDLAIVFQEKITENFHHDGLRNIYRTTDEGSVRIITTDNDPLFQGTKGVSRGCAVYLSLIPRFKQIENSHRQRFDSIIRRFAHNLIKLQTRFKGNFSRLISDNARERPFVDFQEEVKRRIEANTSIAAQDVCQMSHRAVDLDAQIETLRIISGYADNTSPKNRIRVNLMKAIFRLSNPFVDELRKKNVEIIVNIPNVQTGQDKVLVDPDLFNAAIWQLLDNASKYVLAGTPINITATLNINPKKMEMTMTSVCIEEDECELIFLEGTKGRHAGKKGESGIGLFIVRKALRLMGAKISVRNEGFSGDHEGYKYCTHRFTIVFAD